jgi:hypothetical protein
MCAPVFLQGPPLQGTPAQLNSALLPGLETVINRALEKDREQRYQHASELRSDLQRLKQSSEARPAPPRKVISGEQQPDEIAREHTKLRFTSINAMGSVALVILILIAAVLYYGVRRSQYLTNNDTVVLADFVNTTGVAAFDGALKEAPAIQLWQSPFINVLADRRVRATLKLLNRPSNEPLMQAVALDVCQKSNSKALIEGTISSVGERYLVGLTAVSCQTGKSFANVQAEASNTDAVVGTLNKMANKLRLKLGESSASVYRHSNSLEQEATASLDALQAYAAGRAALLRVPETLSH